MPEGTLIEEAAREASRGLLPDLVDSRMLVIGAGDVGVAAAQLTRSLGVAVALADRSEAHLERAQSAVPGADTFQVNARDQASVHRVLDAAGADHILLATGAPLFGHIGNLDLAQVMDWVGDRLEPLLSIGSWIARQDRRPRSFTVVSGWIWLPQPGQLSWAIMGPAIRGAIEHLAIDLSPTRVNAVGPGPMVDSEMVRQAMFADATEEERAQGIAQLASQLPARRAIVLEDTARQILFVAGDPVATGFLRHVDGGMSLTMRPFIEPDDINSAAHR